jgi:hypothetical protein
MDEVDQKIKIEFAQSGEPAPGQRAGGAEVKKIMELVKQQNEKAVRRTWHWTLGWHLFFAVPLLLGAWIILFEPKSDEMPAGLFIATAALAGLVFIKLWYYLTSARLHLEMRLKELEVHIAEMREEMRK